MPIGRSAALHAAAARQERNQEFKAEQEEIARQVEEWFVKFDEDGDMVLSREEMKSLLTHVSGREPTDDALDVAMSKALEVGASDGITRKVAHSIVMKTAAYMKEQAVIDPIFAKYDTDKSGDLDNAELLQLLKLVAKDAQCDPNLVTDADVTRVVEMADKDQSGKIEKCELMWACATWKSMLVRSEAPFQKPAAKSGMCAVL